MAPNMKSSLLFIFLLNYLSVSSSFNCLCKDRPECCCFKNSDHTEYQCPVNGHVIKHYQDFVKVECRNDIPFPQSIPKFNFSSVSSLRLHYCQMGNVTFRQAADHFGIPEVRNLTFELSQSSDRIHLTKKMLEGLETLQSLNIQFTNLTFDEDFLENTPNIIMLNLKHNNIKEIGYVFKNLAKLQYLELSINYITSLPDFIFKNLTDLRVLYLWNNRITSVNENTFVGLKQLRLLEMMKNRLETISEDAFVDLENLSDVYIPDNLLKSIPKKIFRNNPLLTHVRLDRNNLSTSYPKFSNLPKLKFVSLNDCKIKEVPEDLFANSTNIEEINLGKNTITQLPETLFQNLTQIRKLKLSSNKIKYLPDNIFSSLQSLEELYIDNNNLENISSDFGRNLINLKVLKLNNNRLKSIINNAFEKTKLLENVDLSSNELSFSTFADSIVTPFNGCCENLTILNLANNKITEFPQNLLLAHFNKLKELNLSKNLITEIQISEIIPQVVDVDLSDNRIAYVGFKAAAVTALNNGQADGQATLKISRNPVACDCLNVDLARYFTGEGNFPFIRQYIKIDAADVSCGSLGPISDLKPVHMTCTFVGNGCPVACDCSWRPADGSAIVNCFRRNLSDVPGLYMDYEGLARRGYKFDKTIVDLTYNGLERAPSKADGYGNVTVLDLSGNRLEAIGWVPPHLVALNLSNNKIQTLSKDIVQTLENTSTLRSLRLQNNPWSCDCSAVPLQKYLRDHGTQVQIDNIKCANSEEYMASVNEICKSYFTVILGVSFAFLVLFIVFGIVFYFYELEIKVWLYAKNLCMWFVTEDELDKDKNYDVFVSYSNKDEDFVNDKLVPNLENIPDLKICLHQKHFIPGEFIFNQVQKCILDSRRTLVVLSNNFLESMWGQMEFKVAHQQALQDGRVRVVIVILGELDEAKLNDELKSYLKTNTYVKWGDPWFWNKLRYALPHRKSVYRRRHANIMLKIDDKFELCKSPSTPHINTTPPVITLDPGKLKDHPLSFKVDGEVPLMRNGAPPQAQLNEVMAES